MNQHLEKIMNEIRGKKIFMNLNLTQIIRSFKSAVLFDPPEKLRNALLLTCEYVCNMLRRTALR